MRLNILAGLMLLLTISRLHLDWGEVDDFSLRRIRESEFEIVPEKTNWESENGFFRSFWNWVLGPISTTITGYFEEFKDSKGERHRISINDITLK
jgi:hypothetical protein